MSAFDELRNELRRTSVISDEFKITLINHAMAISSDAYGRGIENERQTQKTREEMRRARMLKRAKRGSR